MELFCDKFLSTITGAVSPRAVSTQKSLIKANNEGGKLCNEKIQKAVIYLIEELNEEHERNINNISCDDLYPSPMKENA